MVILINSATGWGILANSFTFVVHSTLNYLLDTLVYSLGGAPSVRI